LTDYSDIAAANRAPLDWLNALLADVQGGVGLFLAVFLTSAQHWEAGAAGIALTVGGIATVLARASAGELVDLLRAKRTLIALAAIVVAMAAMVMAVWPSFWPVMLAQVANGVADAVSPAAVAAISLVSSAAHTSPPESAATRRSTMPPAATWRALHAGARPDWAGGDPGP
jgi:predicted MFS family arabinose efflux permease